MENPVVSIVTITFNSERFLEQTIQSVINQDYPRIEYIIVDGCSTDRTMEIVGRYRDRISKVISEPDDGISDAMNKGIMLSTGEIIGIIHSDDYYADPSVVRRVVDVFRRNTEVKVVYGVQDFISPETGEVLLTMGRDEEPKVMRKRMYLPHPTVFCRREVYDKAGLFRKDYRYAMDYEWALRVVEYTRPYFLNYKLACMRDMGTSSRQYKGAIAEGARALREHGYYLDYVIMRGRNVAKIILVSLGLKRLLYRLWQRNVRPEGFPE